MTVVLVGWDGPEAEVVLKTIPGQGTAVLAPGLLDAARVIDEASGPVVALLREGLTAPSAEGMLEELRGLCPTPDLSVILVLRRGWMGRLRALMDAGADDCVSDGDDLENLEFRVRVAVRSLTRQDDLVRACEEYRQRALRDSLTGAFNRGAILEILEMELQRAARMGSPVGVILADLDHFKALNDEFGHLAGDAALQQVSEAMRRSLRPYDSLGRYGGEEFLVVLPDCPPEVTSVIAERLRNQVETLPSAAGRALTLSLGTSHHQGSRPEPSLRYVEQADQALYEAKRGGRNRVVSGRALPAVRRPVLVVIGDRETMEMFRRTLQDEWDLRPCRRVQDAIAHLQAADLVVTDPDLPGRGGLDFLQKARQRGLLAPVLLVSGRPGPEDLPTLRKPLDPAEVAAAVRSLSAPGPPARG